MYYILSIRKWPRVLEDWIIDFGFEAGALGLSEQLAFSQPDYEAMAEERTTDPYDVDVYFRERPSDFVLQKIAERGSQAQLSVRAEIEKDWLEEWKKGFEPFLICEDIFIVPPWRDVPTEAKQWIFLEPGMAFGTGTHETTRLAARQLGAIFKQKKVHSVLDVGTGTGILAMIAARLGAQKIVAIDNDLEARRVVRENVANNHLEKIVVCDLAVDKLIEKFDVVVANIVDSVLLKIQQSLVRALHDSSFLIVSGLLLENLDDFKKQFQLPVGWSWVHFDQDTEWASAVAKRNE